MSKTKQYKCEICGKCTRHAHTQEEITDFKLKNQVIPIYKLTNRK